MTGQSETKWKIPMLDPAHLCFSSGYYAPLFQARPKHQVPVSLLGCDSHLLQARSWYELRVDDQLLVSWNFASPYEPMLVYFPSILLRTTYLSEVMMIPTTMSGRVDFHPVSMTLSSAGWMVGNVGNVEKWGPGISSSPPRVNHVSQPMWPFPTVNQVHHQFPDMGKIWERCWMKL